MTAAAFRHGPFHIGLTGGSGLIGSALVASLTQNGYRVTRLVRRAPEGGEISWSPSEGILDPHQLESMDAIVHLGGENVAARWTQQRKLKIRESRISGTRLISQTLARLSTGPKLLISASAIGIYGNRGDEILTDSSSPASSGRDFLASVTLDWERAADPARQAGIRVVHPRFGIVLSPAGGALKKMVLPFRLGLGGRLGNGSQWMSWIAIDDVVGAIQHVLETPHITGALNVTAPEPVTNRDFTASLGRVLSRPTPFVVPAVALRLALGEMAQGTVLASARVIPTRLLDSGYHFRHPSLEPALRDVLGTRR
jgi:uncharacterized protein (TIGR01777 family)